MLRRRAAWIFPVALIVMGSGTACGQNYPLKPIRIVTVGVGGGNDILSRILAAGLSGPLGQQVIVENRGGGVIPGEIVAKSPPDGYTLLLYGSGIWTGPLLEKTPYAASDFAPITLAARAPIILVVNPALPVKSVRELIALAKARPGALNYGSAGVGTGTHLAAELFNSMASVNIVRVFYRDDMAQTIDLISGQVQLSFGTPGAVSPHIKSGRLRALAVTSPTPSVFFPALPTVAASLPGYEAGTSYGVWAPANTPEAIVKRLNQDIVRYLNTAEAKARLQVMGVDVIGSSPEEFAATIKSDVVRLSKVIRDAGIRAD